MGNVGGSEVVSLAPILVFDGGHESMNRLPSGNLLFLALLNKGSQEDDK
jgi:hypothetical protein